MFRRLLNFVTGLSLLLCVAVVGLWVRSHFVVDVVEVVAWHHASSSKPVRNDWRAMSVRGAVALIWERDESRPTAFAGGGPTFAHSLLSPGDFRVPPKFYWFNSGQFTAGRSRLSRGLWTTYGLPFLGSALLPVRWLARRWSARPHFPPGHCGHCGYDLRATPDKCPECGLVASVTTSP